MRPTTPSKQCIVLSSSRTNLFLKPCIKKEVKVGYFILDEIARESEKLNSKIQRI